MASTKVIIDPVAEAGYASGKSEDCDKSRHSYSDEVFAFFRGAIGDKKDQHVAEIGCGTGIFTRKLLSIPEWSSAISELKLVEPNEGMLSVLRSTIQDSRTTGISAGTFESTDLPDSWADIVFGATAFHWCTDFEAALNEFSRVLKPGGHVALVWNYEDRSVPWVGQMWTYLIQFQSVTQASMTLEHLQRWRVIFDLPFYKQSFHPPRNEVVRSSGISTLEKVVARAMTWSGVAIQSDETKQEIKVELQKIIERGEGLVWVDKENGTFELPFAAEASVFQKKE